MSAYNFQRRFASAIKRGRKRCTIRARRKNGYVPKAGERIKLYTGMRTRGCQLLRQVTVKKVTPILIDETEYFVGRVIIEGRPLPQEIDFETIIKRDGFGSWPEFAAFFKSQHGLPFSGYLIEW